MSYDPSLLAAPSLNGKYPSKTVSTPLQSFNWSYQFRDGSQLVGTVDGYLANDGNQLLHPTRLRANYLSRDGETVLLSWRDRDFACFDSTLNGQDLLIVGSNDCFTENSICLVNGETRQRSQVTDGGTQLVVESFRPHAWLLTPVTSPQYEPDLGLKWSVLPYFPYLTVNFNFWLINPKTVYQWTFFPYFPFFPYLRVANSASS